MPKPTNGRPLDALAAEADRLPAVLRTDLRSGDFLLVTTRNSVYSLCLLEDGSYSVAGGWFDRQGDSPQRVGRERLHVRWPRDQERRGGGARVSFSSSRTG